MSDAPSYNDDIYFLLRNTDIPVRASHGTNKNVCVTFKLFGCFYYFYPYSFTLKSCNTMSLLATIIQTAVKKVQENNRKDPNVKTADSSIFDKLKEKFEDVKNNAGPRERGESTNILDQLRNRIDDVKRDNEADPNVETADNVVFDDMKRELEELKAKIAAEEQVEADNRIAELRAQMEREEQAKEDARMEQLRAQIKREEQAKADAARRQREAEEEDARRKRESEIRMPSLDDLNINKPNVSQNRTIPRPVNPPQPSVGYKEVTGGQMALTNSNGGSLQLRTNPDMGAPMTKIFVPDASMIRVLNYSDHTVNLDGRDIRFVLVEYDGQKGWTFESYLNFN